MHLEKNTNLKITYNASPHELVKLRKISYKNFYKDLDVKNLDWNLTDSQSLHVGIVFQNQLVSTIRISCFNSRSRFFNTCRLDLPTDDSLPVVVLSRGATIPEFHGYGFHTRLRLEAIKICYHNQLFNIFGAMSADTSRIKNLLSIGYEIVDTKEAWNGSFLNSRKQAVLLQLQGEAKINNAIKLLSKKLDLIGFDQSYPIIPVIVD